MALFHLSAKIISRGDGNSACAASAYISGTKIVAYYDGRIHDYRRRRYVEDAVVLLPENATKRYEDRKVLWNEVELNERSSRAQLAREIEIALPEEFDFENRRKMVLEFVKEQFVDEGMIADVAFHKKHLSKTPYEKEPPNPHVHILLTMRPLDSSGNWESKNSTMYLCEKSGKRRLLSSEEITSDPGWEKLYNYHTPSGEKLLLTKSYVEQHKDKGYKLVNKYPKRENVKNPKVAEWDSPETLIKWREAWAAKVNYYYEMRGMNLRIDHRSYKEQGLDLIPTVHEGKAVTAIERIREEEYKRKIANGEEANLEHTEIRNLNIAIRQHNEEIRILMGIEKLKTQLQQIIEPVIRRIEAISESVAETLERLRAEIISIKKRITEAVDIRYRIEEGICMSREYIKSLSPIHRERFKEIKRQRDALEKEYDSLSDAFSKKKKALIADRIDILNSEIRIQQENRKYAKEAKTKIQNLQIDSKEADARIEEMRVEYNDRIREYDELVSFIAPEDFESIEAERLKLRPRIEEDFGIRGCSVDACFMNPIESQKMDDHKMTITM